MAEKTKRSRLPLAGGLALLAAAGIWAATRVYGCGEERIPGATNEQRVAYIESFGWVTGLTHSSLEEVRIPVEFDETYEEYNALQRRQGFDLRRYRAHTVKKYTYDLEGDGVPLCATLLVENGEIIGADITSPKAGGFQGALAVDG